MPAEYARFKREDFKVALQNRERLNKNGCLTLLFPIWLLCSAAVARLLLSALEREGEAWWHILLLPALFLFVIGPPAFLPYWLGRPSRPFLKCPCCKGATNRHNNQKYILATGKCGWCSSEVLEPESSYSAAVPPVPSKGEFEKITPSDLTDEIKKKSPRERTRIAAFAALYVAGLLPFLWVFHSAAEYGKPIAGRVFVSVFVTWLFLSPMLWLRLVHRLKPKHFLHCPSCGESLNQMLALATGRCGSCGVQIIKVGDENRMRLPAGHDDPLSPSLQVEKFTKFSRTGFMSLQHSMKDEHRQHTAIAAKRVLPFFGSSLVVLVTSILFLSAPWTLIVPLAWYLGAGAVDQYFLDRQLRRTLKSRTESSNAPYFHCPACGKSTEFLNGSLLVATGRCAECLNAILYDDTMHGQSQP